ncbi:MAG: DUF4197 domain-containing protein [Candidatus Krumholzibacteria bacterium]|nr:DUF4197 domain-containing protein [Candidatus Krumholzibacteria bacterium]
MKSVSIMMIVVTALLVAGCFDSATLDKMFQDDGALDESTVAAGLKEALRVGTERSTASTSKLDGFYKNALIRIVMPEQYAGVAKTLNSFGMGSYVDDFERSMNRAAERASGEAIDVFWSAITQMSISDAFGILNGGETAATDYFRRNTTASLTARFQPIVTAKMEEVGVYNFYNDLVAKYNMLPIDKPEAVDIDDYVTVRTIDGIFSVLEGEEKRIRDDPAARTTELLRKVFGDSGETH